MIRLFAINAPALDYFSKLSKNKLDMVVILCYFDFAGEVSVRLETSLNSVRSEGADGVE